MQSKPNKLRTSTRDIQIHAAVTIMPNKNNVAVIGEKDLEIMQKCVQLDAKFAPFKEEQVRVAFQALAAHAIEIMRSAGYIR